MKMMVLFFLYLIYIFKVRTGLLIEDLPSVFKPNNCWPHFERFPVLFVQIQLMSFLVNLSEIGIILHVIFWNKLMPDWMIFFLFFSVRLLSVLRGHSIFSSPPQRPMTSDFEGFSIPDFIHYIIFLSYFLRKSQYFPFSMLSAKQGNYWYHFYNIFGMTRSLTGDWTRDPPHSKPALHHYAIEEAVE